MAFSPTEGPVRTFLSSVVPCLLVAAVLFPLAGCIAHAPGSGGGGQQQLSVTVSSPLTSPYGVPVSTAAQPSTVNFTASVQGTSNQAITWTLVSNPNAGTVCTATGSGLGTIISTGTSTATYTAPQGPLPMSPCDVAVVATASEDGSTTGTAQANVHVIVSVSPQTFTVGQGANLQLTATVTGATSQTVDWSVSCASCTGQQTAGIVDPSNPGLYIAPGLQSGITSVQAAVNATSTFDTTQSTAATITVNKNDPLGTASPSTAAAATITCPTFTGGVTGATCYKVTVSCDAIADWNTYLKVNQPNGTPVGTVILGTGGGGGNLYDNDPSFIVGSFNGGESIVSDLLNLGVQDQGYTTVQVSFGTPFDNSSGVVNGWLQGPGGVRRLACRYATLADWVYKNIHNSNHAAPYCATGNSGGSGAIGYAVSEYALASEFSLIEMTSGPVMTLLQQGCNVCGQYTGADPCNQTTENMCYTASGGIGSTAAIIDTAYQAVGQTTPALCTNGVNGDNSQFSRFLSDSIEDDPGISPALPIPNPPTAINVVFGADDTSNAIPQGYAWRGGVGPTPPPPVCVPNTPHALPSTAGGAAQIVSDIQNSCKIH